MTGAAFTALYPTTPAQQGFLLGTLANPDTAVFVEQTVFPLTGPLDPARLQAAATELVADHEILRTALAWDLTSDPRQVVLPSAELPIGHLDSSGKTAHEQDDDLDCLLNLQRHTTFDVHRPPLLRLAIQRLGPQSHQLVWSHHHAILDGRAHLLLATELLHRYNSGTRPGPQPPFGPYARWLAGQPREQQQAHWTKHLDGYAGCPPLNRSPHGPAADRFGQHSRDLPGALVADLTAFTQAHGTTTSAALVACWSLIAARHRDRTDIAIGVTVSGRSHAYPGAADLVGPLASTVPLRCPPHPHEGAGAWISRVHDELAYADQHSGCSTTDLYTWAAIPEGQSLYDSVIAVANYPHTPAQPGDSTQDDGLLVLDSAGIRAYGGRTRHALTLVVEMTAGLRLRLVNDRTKISDDQACAALDVMCTLLDRLKPGTADQAGDLARHTAALAPFPEPTPQHPENSTADHGHDPVLNVVTAHFAALLGHRTDPDTDFLAAGGHSLLALRLVGRLRGAFAVDLPLGAVLTAPTPRTMAQHVRELVLGATETAPLEALPPMGASTGESSEPFTLTGIQQAYWAGRRDDFDLGGVDSHLYAEADVPDLDVDRLAQVWRTLIDRHPMLRAVITEDGRQLILPTVTPYEIHTADFRHTGDAEEQVAAARTRLSHPRRNTAAWPLFTIEAALLPGGVTRLFLSFDLLIGDALSWQILYREARARYENASTELPALTVTFADYVAYQHTLRSSSRYARDRAYWHARLPELPAPPLLPVTVGQGRPRFHRVHTLWSPRELAALRAVAAAHGTTLSALLLAAFSESLGRFTNSRSFLVNVTVYNRPPLHPQINHIVGDFTSTILASVDLSGATFADRLRTLQHQLWADLDHSTYSGVDVLRELRGTVPGAPVVFTSTLDLDAPGEDPGPFPGRIVYGIGQTPQVLLDYQTYEAAGHLVINLDSVAGTLPEHFAAALLDDHTAALRTLIEDPAAAQRPRLTAPPAVEELAEPLGGEQLLHQPFLDRVRDHPSHAALRCDGRTLTYAELHGQAVKVAGRINAAPPAGDMIALVCDPGADQAIAALGVLLAGYAYVPVDASWPAQRITDLLTTTGADLVLTHQTAADRLAPLTARVVVIDDGQAAPRGNFGGQDGGRQRTATDLAYVIFTSGSTGQPKGVMISHRGALNTVLDINRRYAVGARDVLLGVSPFTFDLAVYDLFGALAAGATLVLPTRQERTDPAAWIRLIRSFGVTVWNSVPTLAQLLLDSLPGDGGDTLRSVRLWLLSGDWIPLSLPDRLRARSEQCQVISLGGATEGSIWSILHEITDVEPGWASIPYGMSMTGQRVQILDNDLLPCPAWTPGQIHITGHGTALGYWGAPELTEAAFVFDGRTGQTWYRTGDWGRSLPDGTIEFLGRRDDQVKIRGYRVELREVETALSALGGVKQAAVVVTGDRSEKRLHAVVVCDRPLADLRAELALRLPSHMLPSTLTGRTDLPHTTTGKIDRAELARAIPQPVPTTRPAQTPQTGLLRDALCALLPAPALDHEDLLGLGLTSLDVIRLANLVEQHTGRRPDLAEFYRTPTLHTLLQHGSGGASPGDSLVPAANPSPWTAAPVLTQPGEREGFRAARPAYPPAPAHRILPAVQPSASSRGRRFSPRTFGARPVTLAALGDLLECLRREPAAPGRSGFLYPSAGGLYSVQVHLYAAPGRVEGLDGGLYRYHPGAHDLLAEATGIDVDPAALHLGPVNRPVASTAAFTLFLVTDPADSAPLYGVDAEPLALLNAGYMGQLLCEQAAAAGLGLCPVHGVDFDPVRWLLSAGERLVLLHTLLGGVPADQTGEGA